MRESSRPSPPSLTATGAPSPSAFLMITDPKYLTEMVGNPLGKKMVYGAIGGQIVGYFVIKKIIAIKV